MARREISDNPKDFIASSQIIRRAVAVKIRVQYCDLMSMSCQGTRVLSHPLGGCQLSFYKNFFAGGF